VSEEFDSLEPVGLFDRGQGGVAFDDFVGPPEELVGPQLPRTHSGYSDQIERDWDFRPYERLPSPRYRAIQGPPIPVDLLPPNQIPWNENHPHWWFNQPPPAGYLALDRNAFPFVLPPPPGVVTRHFPPNFEEEQRSLLGGMPPVGVSLAGSTSFPVRTVNPEDYRRPELLAPLPVLSQQVHNQPPVDVNPHGVNGAGAASPFVADARSVQLSRSTGGHVRSTSAVPFSFHRGPAISLRASRRS